MRRTEKLGDGTVAAIAMHTADNYHRIADYLRADIQPSVRKPERRRHSRQPPGHGPRRGHGHGDGAAAYCAENIDPRSLLERLASARTRLGLLAELSDEQLAAVPPSSEMRFADGQRTLEEIVVSLLGHQRHQRDALAAALPSSGQAA